MSRDVIPLGPMIGFEIEVRSSTIDTLKYLKLVSNSRICFLGTKII